MTVGGAQRSHVADQTVSSPSAMRGVGGWGVGSSLHVDFDPLAFHHCPSSQTHAQRCARLSHLFFLKSRTATKINAHTAEES